MSIYTRTGDTGSTFLFGGKRVLKCEELVEVYGSIDELNSWIGLITSNFKIKNSKLKRQTEQLLETIQGDLFTIGSILAGRKEEFGELEKRVQEMEEGIDEIEKELLELKNFILPGGSEIGSLIHITRSICRRVERQVVSLKVGKVQKVLEVQEEDLDKIIKYLNRLSDLLFVLARFINKQENVEEMVWSASHSKP